MPRLAVLMVAVTELDLMAWGSKAKWIEHIIGRNGVGNGGSDEEGGGEQGRGRIWMSPK